MSGRPTKLDDLSAKRIVDAIAAGGSRSAAAEAARVHRSTLMGWLARGREGDPAYFDFLDRVKKAEAEAENEMVAIVRKAAMSGTWQAAAWWLERRRPNAYALRREPRDGSKATDAIGGSAAMRPLDADVLESLLAAVKSNQKGRTDE